MTVTLYVTKYYITKTSSNKQLPPYCEQIQQLIDSATYTKLIIAEKRVKCFCAVMEVVSVSVLESYQHTELLKTALKKATGSK